MTDIQILPIFDQSAPGVWDDMLRIRVATMKHNYGVVMSPLDISQAYTDYANAWQTNAKNFAFAAYDAPVSTLYHVLFGKYPYGPINANLGPIFTFSSLEQPPNIPAISVSVISLAFVVSNDTKSNTVKL